VTTTEHHGTADYEHTTVSTADGPRPCCIRRPDGGGQASARINSHVSGCPRGGCPHNQDVACYACWAAHRDSGATP